MMTTDRANLFSRDDTFFGVCQGLGEDLGVPPTLLRIAFALGLFWNPIAMIGLYAALGLVVLAARLIVREPRALQPAPTVEPQAAATPAEQPQPEAIPLAA